MPDALTSDELDLSHESALEEWHDFEDEHPDPDFTFDATRERLVATRMRTLSSWTPARRRRVMAPVPRTARATRAGRATTARRTASHRRRTSSASSGSPDGEPGEQPAPLGATPASHELAPITSSAHAGHDALLRQRERQYP